jgi:hypothetical protein
MFTSITCAGCRSWGTPLPTRGCSLSPPRRGQQGGLWSKLQDRPANLGAARSAAFSIVQRLVTMPVSNACKALHERYNFVQVRRSILNAGPHRMIVMFARQLPTRLPAGGPASPALGPALTLGPAQRFPSSTTVDRSGERMVTLRVQGSSTNTRVL